MLLRRLVPALLLAVVVLSGCQTEPATNITTTSATLSASSGCAGAYKGAWSYQVRRVGTSTFANVGPAETFECRGAWAGPDFALRSQSVTGLQPGTTYEYRVFARLSSGETYWFDSNGTLDGTKYDRFTTKAVPEPVPTPTPTPTPTPIPGAAVSFGSVITDNYKACFHVDPNAVENRTYLSFTSIVVGGRSYTAAASAGVVSAAGGARMALRDSAGRSVTLEISSATGPVWSLLYRTDASRRTGILIATNGAAALKLDSIRLTLVVRDSAARQIGTSQLEYRYDKALATAPVGDIEHNGPGGRWYVDGARTLTDVETVGNRC